MTTFWARLKIWEAYKSCNIPSTTAEYFDDLLNKKRFKKKSVYENNTWTTKYQEIINFNNSTDSVLNNVGTYIKGDSTIGFHVPTYMAVSTYGNKTIAGIIGEDYFDLYNEIMAYINSKYVHYLEIADIQTYLQRSHYLCCKNQDKQALMTALAEKRAELEKLEEERLAQIK